MVGKDTTRRINSRGHMASKEAYDPTAMVFASLTPEAKLTDEQLAMLEDAKRHPIVFDEDCPPLSPSSIAAFRESARIRDARKHVG